MKKKDLSPVRVEQLGFSQREFLVLFILRKLTEGTSYPKVIHKELRERFPEKVHSYDYLCKVAKQIETEGLVVITFGNRKNNLSITTLGETYLHEFEKRSKKQIQEVQAVIQRFVKEITGSGETIPVTHQLAEEHRPFFSKLVSVKDLVRYVTLKEALSRKYVYMSEIRSLLQDTFGWEASNGYLYELAIEMEEKNLLEGRWDGDRRAKRLLSITEEGRHHYKQIADSTRERLLQIKKFLHRILYLLEGS